MEYLLSFIIKNQFVASDLVQPRSSTTIESDRDLPHTLNVIQHLERKIISLSGLTENEVEPGMLRSSVQRTCWLSARKNLRGALQKTIDHCF